MIKSSLIIIKILFSLFLFFFTFSITSSLRPQIGPEIPIDGFTGYLDIQSIGPCKHYLNRVNNSVVHAVFSHAPDSSNPLFRKTRYSFSDDNGISWTFLGEVPASQRSGLPSLTSGTTEVAIIGNTTLSPVVSSCVHVDILPGGGTFSSACDPSFAEPQIAVLSNGNIIVGAQTYRAGGYTDTGVVRIFNPSTMQWVGNPKYFVSSAFSQDSMRYTAAAGPGGKAIFIIDAHWGRNIPVGGNKIVYWTSSDFGVTWSSENLLFQSHIDSTGDTVHSWTGLDAMYDATGNFYIVFNTIADSLQTAKLWMSKNGNAPALAASNLQIQGSAKNFTHSLWGLCSMDCPSLCISNDGAYIFCSYSVVKQYDIVNGFQACDIYTSFSHTYSLNFYGIATQITSGSIDEQFVSLNAKAYPYINGYLLRMVYQKDPQPGSYLDNAPRSIAYLVYKEFLITFPGVKKTGSKIPDRFSLYQNYPNPFNPATKIRFDIPHSPLTPDLIGGTKGNKGGFTTLVIYDVLGREIATLVNEPLQPGTYEVEWDGTNHPSGAYFYKLDAGEFMETKRMVLVK